MEEQFNKHKLMNRNFLRNTWLISIALFSLVLTFSTQTLHFLIVGFIVIVGLLLFLLWIISLIREESLNKRRKAKSFFAGLGLMFLLGVGLLIFYGLIVNRFLYKTQFHGNSITNLQDGKYYLGCRTCKDLKRGDIVTYPLDEFTDKIGRIVGLPNENIEIEQNKLSINGKISDEPYADWSKWDTTEKITLQLASDEYFALSDKRYFKDMQSFIKNNKFKISNFKAKLFN